MLKGGLGNQMFQYAFGRFISERYATPLFLNTKIYDEGRSNRGFDLDVFRLSKCTAGHESFIQRPVIETNILFINERYFHFDPSHVEYLDTIWDIKTKLIVLTGYWQSYKYFAPIENNIRFDFTLTASPADRWLRLLHLIKDSESIMINVRRTDYLLKLEYHGVVSTEYLTQAIAIIKQKIRQPKYFIFSDDIPWCRKYLGHIKEAIFVDETYYDVKYQLYFQLMTNCKHFILSNSSFCWWAAWLGATSNSIVIYPKKWFAVPHLDIKDLTPLSWTGL
ncbi:alpha-1,2-fucosyltransferase [Pedobacter deserti]|uniref:alpha-1,2-fucosyltransferase n=1 Tax=Pedobacter deserti TaxID=2817382 RepID=UPI00210B94E3|nr:alpha-1,2-fucosyltransferase [Pedobacter sp. SYSU D00382]